jgi:hypothetical protein
LQALELQVFEVGLVEAVERGRGSGLHGRNLSLCLGVFPLRGREVTFYGRTGRLSPRSGSVQPALSLDAKKRRE